MFNQSLYFPTNSADTSPVVTQPQRRERAELMILPFIIVGLMVAFYGLYRAPWQADYEDAQIYNTATHWERLQGNDGPKDAEGKPLKDAEGRTMKLERPAGYEMRRVVDVTIYISIVFSGLCVVGVTILNRGWVYLPMLGAALLGVLYAGTAGVLMGPLITGAGFTMVLFGASLGWFASSRT